MGLHSAASSPHRQGHILTRCTAGASKRTLKVVAATVTCCHRSSRGHLPADLGLTADERDSELRLPGKVDLTSVHAVSVREEEVEGVKLEERRNHRPSSPLASAGFDFISSLARRTPHELSPPPLLSPPSCVACCALRPTRPRTVQTGTTYTHTFNPPPPPSFAKLISNIVIYCLPWLVCYHYRCIYHDCFSSPRRDIRATESTYSAISYCAAERYYCGTQFASDLLANAVHGAITTIHCCASTFLPPAASDALQLLARRRSAICRSLASSRVVRYVVRRCPSYICASKSCLRVIGIAIRTDSSSRAAEERPQRTATDTTREALEGRNRSSAKRRQR